MSIWNKLDSGLSSIYLNYLQVKEKGRACSCTCASRGRGRRTAECVAAIHRRTGGDRGAGIPDHLEYRKRWCNRERGPGRPRAHCRPSWRTEALFQQEAEASSRQEHSQYLSRPGVEPVGRDLQRQHRLWRDRRHHRYRRRYFHPYLRKAGPPQETRILRVSGTQASNRRAAIPNPIHRS